MSTSSPKLLEPINLKGLELKNRIVMAPLTRARAGKDRLPNDIMAEHYAQRASAGLIVSEATTISPRANGWNESPGIYTDAMVEGWKLTTEAVHAKGGKIFLQLWHMGRVSHSGFHDGALPLAPSAIKIENGEEIYTPIGKMPYETPQAIATEEIPGIIDEYRTAAKNAQLAGFDGVEIHAANGYLLDQFLQARTNQRTDQYGGSIENRTRMLTEVVEAVTEVWDAERVGVRLSPNGVFNDMGSPDFREQFLYAAKTLDQHHLAYLHLVDGLAFGFHDLGEAMTLSEFREVYSGTLIGNCGYDQTSAEEAIATGKADMIALGRLFISNPDLVERFANGWELNPDADMSTWYSTPGREGYNDFPFYQA